MSWKVSDYAIKANYYNADIWKILNRGIRKLDIELSERCNNNCRHCYINQSAGDKKIRNRELKTEKIKQYLKQACELGCLTVRFTGGEPLLRQDFRNLYLYARKLGLKVLLFTNGTLITRELAELFAEIPPLEPVEITLYGSNDHHYRSLAGVPNFHACRRGIQFLLQYNIPFKLKAVELAETTEQEKENLQKFAQSLSAELTISQYASFISLRARHDSPEKNEEIKKLRKKSKKTSVEERRQNLRHCAKFSKHQGAKLFQCRAGMDIANIDAYGNMQMCLLLRHPDTIFSVNKEYIAKGMEHFKEIRQRKSNNPEYLERCARCFLKNLCKQCPAQSWMEHGTLDTPVEYLCRETHQKNYDMGLLIEGEKSWEIEDWPQRLEKMIKEL